MFPVEEKVPEIRRALAANRTVVLTAPPGSGKTTCVPPALLEEPWLAGKRIVMLEPRRLAARTCAAYMARRRGEQVGGTVGYQVRLERHVSAATRLEVVTEGLLAQRLLADPELNGVGLVIFDEFHERSLQCDLAFALALETRRALREDLRLVVMSATLDADEVAAHLGDAATVRAEGRMFPVETKYLEGMTMPGAIARARKETDGTILCFLPGEGEIRRVAEAVPDALPLYGALPKEEQDRVFADDGRRKTILATSIAETSVTIPGVSVVIDSGLMRIQRFSPATGMSGLVTAPLPLDRAEQRRGRAGRVMAGTCYRLWREGENLVRPKKSMPEILDADLAQLVLASASWGATRRTCLPWLTPPPAAAWDQASGLLRLLGALDPDGRLTAKGERMARIPIHPRLANMILGGGDPMLAAIIEEGTKSRETDIRLIRPTPRMKELAKRVARGPWFARRETIDAGRETLDERRASLTSRVPRQNPLVSRLTSHAHESRTTNHELPTTNHELSPGAALALAYPDRIAKGRGNGMFRMVSGRGAFVDQSDPLAKEPFLVCCRLDDRLGDAKVFLGCPIGEHEIEELFADRIVEEPFCAWDRRTDRVVCAMRRKLGEMVMRERPLDIHNLPDLGEPGVLALPSQPNSPNHQQRTTNHPPSPRLRRTGQPRTTNLPNLSSVASALLDGVRTKGVTNLPCWTKESLQLRSRVAFLHRVLGENGGAPWPELSDGEILSALEGFVSGMTKWRDLERVEISRVIDFILAESGHDRRELDRLAPSRMEVPSGSHMTIRYGGDEPTVEVRLQECFGLMDTPKVAGGRVPVVMTLLSPAQRPVQVTKDLAGFWKEGYPLVRRDMRGRYPKHYWPEDPFSAVATRRVRPRAE